MNVTPIAKLGLETIAEVSARKGRGWSQKIVINRIRAGQLPAVVVATGRGGLYLLRTSDVDAYVPPGQGARTDRPEGAKRGRKK